MRVGVCEGVCSCSLCPPPCAPELGIGFRSSTENGWTDGRKDGKIYQSIQIKPQEWGNISIYLLPFALAIFLQNFILKNERKQMLAKCDFFTK